MYRNSERYADPTAGAAMSRVMKEYKDQHRQLWMEKQAIKSRRKVYVVSQHSGNTEASVNSIIRYCTFVIKQKCIPVAGHLLYPAVLNQTVTKEHDLGLLFSLSLMAVCHEVWVFGKENTDTTKAEIAEAKRLHKTIRYFNEEVHV